MAYMPYYSYIIWNIILPAIYGMLDIQLYSVFSAPLDNPPQHRAYSAPPFGNCMTHVACCTVCSALKNAWTTRAYSAPLFGNCMTHVAYCDITLQLQNNISLELENSVSEPLYCRYIVPPLRRAYAAPLYRKLDRTVFIRWYTLSRKRNYFICTHKITFMIRSLSDMSCMQFRWGLVPPFIEASYT